MPPTTATSSASAKVTPLVAPAALPTTLPAIEPTDGELLNQFTRHGDADALAAVVDRHSALVWTICSRLLAQRADAEDAFQATMLILAKKASSVRANDSAGGWLLRVAHHTALLAKRQRKRRREADLATSLGDEGPPAPEREFPNIEQRQITAVLLQELRGLPEKYQTPLVLRYLEGKSRRQIADATDATVAKVAGQLARGKRMLRLRLARRGVSLAVAMAAFTGTASAASAASPTSITAPPPFDPGMVASGASAAVSSLVTQGARSMLFASLAKPAAAGAACMVAALGLLVEGEAGAKAPVADAPGSPALVLEANAPADEPTAASTVTLTATETPANHRHQRPEEQGKPNRLIIPTITTKDGQPATIGVESESGKTELTVTPTIKGDAVEIAAEVKTTESQRWGETDEQDLARAREEFAKQARLETNVDFSQPSFAELYALQQYWARKESAAAESIEDVQQLLESGQTTEAVHYDVTHAAITEQFQAEAKRLEVERLMKQAALRETRGQAKPDAWAAKNTAPLRPLPRGATSPEESLREKALDLLEHIPGVRVQVRVNEASPGDAAISVGAPMAYVEAVARQRSSDDGRLEDAQMIAATEAEISRQIVHILTPLLPANEDADNYKRVGVTFVFGSSSAAPARKSASLRLQPPTDELITVDPGGQVWFRNERMPVAELLSRLKKSSRRPAVLKLIRNRTASPADAMLTMEKIYRGTEELGVRVKLASFSEEQYAEQAEALRGGLPVPEASTTPE